MEDGEDSAAEVTHDAMVAMVTEAAANSGNTAASGTEKAKPTNERDVNIRLKKIALSLSQLYQVNLIGLRSNLK